MKHIGAVILSFEETGDLSGLVPWKQNRTEEIFRELQSRTTLTGMIYLSTCNRVEFIYSLSDMGHTDFALALMELMPTLPAAVRPSFLQGRAAGRHLLRLTAGLESMVLGETEIRAQLKSAYEDSVRGGLLDNRLRNLFQHIFREAREVRSSLPLENLPLSVATLAMKRLQPRLVRDTQGVEEAPAVVVIGSGPMSRQSAEYLSKWFGDRIRLVLVNRTLSKIAETADRLGAELLSFDRFLSAPEKIGPIAAVVTATSRADAFITSELAGRFEAAGRLHLIDLALPGDIDAACAAMQGVELHNMESLREDLEANRNKRREAAELAREAIDAALFRVKANLILNLSGPVMRDIQKDVRDKSRAHLNDLLNNRLSHLSGRDVRLIYQWAIQANRDLNRIHRRGLEDILRQYYETPTPFESPAGSVGPSAN